MKERRCAKCGNWSPHILYSFVGYCCEKKEFSFHESLCEFFIELSFEEDFVWCNTCKTLILSEESEEHLSKGHGVFKRVFLDSDYREEIYEG
ncbi:MAG: hypothetical protein NZ879_05035 [Archaeoglobaceae archaeon]|nr:hypothetical protein [Archaeoglobaceae archaeon]MDW8118330.1 hypothetical protein [Archaeoglobaceae archaeon]